MPKVKLLSSDLGYNRTNSFTIRFTASFKNVISNPIGPLSVGLAQTLSLAIAPVPGDSVDPSLVTQPILRVIDQFGNPISGVTVTASLGGGTGVLRGIATAVTNASGLASFSDLGYNKAGEVFHLHFAADKFSLDSANLGPLGPGAAKKVQVETAPDSSGILVPTQNLKIGSTLTVFCVVKDQYDNFIANVSADSWALLNKTGATLDGDLIAAADMKSARVQAKERRCCYNYAAIVDYLA
jgi:hypothetical protein